MRAAHTTYLFGSDRIAAATAGSGLYGHSFGGPPDRRGTSRDECRGLLIHLLHRFDLTDPAVPVRVPGVRWLPLYYCFDFRTNDLGYRLLSDEELVVYVPDDDRNVSAEESWPAADYPPTFPRSDVTVAGHAYDPTDPEDAYRWAGVFGIGRLSPADQAAVKRKVSELMDGLGFLVPETDEEFAEALSSPFLQGRPRGTCLNPGCPNRRAPGSLSTVALVPAEPVPGVNTFGPYGDADLIVMHCPLCHTLRVTNQCD